MVQMLSKNPRCFRVSIKGGAEIAKPWSSLEEGDEGCSGPSGKVLCF